MAATAQWLWQRRSRVSAPGLQAAFCKRRRPHTLIPPHPAGKRVNIKRGTEPQNAALGMSLDPTFIFEVLPCAAWDSGRIHPGGRNINCESWRKANILKLTHTHCEHCSVFTSCTKLGTWQLSLVLRKKKKKSCRSNDRSTGLQHKVKNELFLKEKIIAKIALIKRIFPEPHSVAGKTIQMWNTYIIYLGLHTYFYFSGLWWLQKVLHFSMMFRLFVPKESWLVMDDLKTKKLEDWKWRYDAEWDFCRPSLVLSLTGSRLKASRH